MRPKTTEETQVADGGRRASKRAAQRRRGERTTQGFLQGPLEEIVGGQAQPIIFWTPWCALPNPFSFEGF